MGLIYQRVTGPLRAGEIAERLDALPSSITRHIQALVESDLATTPDPADRRAVLVEATDAGRAGLRQFLEVGDQVFGAVIADWSAEDIVTLTRLLGRMIDARSPAGSTQQQQLGPGRITLPCTVFDGAGKGGNGFGFVTEQMKELLRFDPQAAEHDPAAGGHYGIEARSV
jgi:DNA-binding MarR family transcriptional regulator